MKVCKVCGMESNFREKNHKGDKVVTCPDCQGEKCLNTYFSKPQDRIKERLNRIGYHIK